MTRGTLVAILAVAAPAEAQLAKRAEGLGGKVHALLVCDNRDPAADPAGLGVGPLNDCKRVQAMLVETLPSERRGTILVRTWQQANPDAFRKEIAAFAAKLKDVPNDTMLVYFAGHGAYRDGKHVLQLPGGDLGRDELLGELLRVPAQLRLLVTDCCSYNLTKKPAKYSDQPMNDVAVPAAPTTRPDYVVARQLLLQHRGLVNLNASSIRSADDAGELAWGDDAGGLFTTVLVDPFYATRPGEWDADRDGFVGWREAFGRVRERTKTLYEGFKGRRLRGNDLAVQERGMLQKQTTQTPQVLNFATFGGSVVDSRDKSGVWMFMVMEGTPAEEAGFQGGNVEKIVAVDGTPVATKEDWTRLLDAIPPGRPIRVAYLRSVATPDGRQSEGPELERVVVKAQPYEVEGR